MPTDNIRGNDTGLTGTLGDIVATYQQLSQFSAAMFEPLARLYVGNLAARSEKPLDAADVVNLALKKLLYEAGEVAMAAGGDPAADPRARLAVSSDAIPDPKLAYLAAGIMAYLKSRDEREADRLAAARRAEAAPQAEVMRFAAPSSVRALRASARAPLYATAAHAGVSNATAAAHGYRATGGCGTCGDRGDPKPPPPAPCYDPCAGGLVPVPPVDEPCGCASCRGGTTSAPETCPPFFSISCETQRRIRECLKIFLCKLLEEMGTNLCQNPTTPFAKALCAFMQCLPGAICPPPKQPNECAPPSPMPCLPCDYAVETKPTLNPSNNTILRIR
jgi:hypothetical protein